MSARTGTTSIPPPPASVRGTGRLKANFFRLFSDPNPVWMREMRQAARLSRTPVILATLTAMVTLLICSVGGIASTSAEPARVGSALFHTFFSLAFAVVTWVGPAVAASTIASERSGRTWEALELTGLGAARIARGKCLAALNYISLYIVMLAPVGALPFLFGGVTASEIVLAFILLGVFACESTAFGLAMSSKFASPALCILVTLFVAVSCSIAVYVGGGVGLSFAANELWPGVGGGAPVWLPSAYVRADFSLEYVAFLLLAPLALMLIPAWLFYEVTIANMAPPSDDRSTRLRIWTLVSTFTLTLASVLPGVATRELGWFVVGMLLLFVFFVFAAFLMTGEPLGPSHRVRVHFARENASRLRRYFGPGVMNAASLLLWLCAVSFLSMILVGALSLSGPNEVEGVVAFGGYALAFLVFVVGFGAWARSRSPSSAVPRVLLLLALFLAIVGPWVIMAIAGILAGGSDAIVVAAPSPAYAFYLLEAVARSSYDRDAALAAGTVCAAAWLLLGLGLLALAASTSARRVKEELLLREQLEKALDQQALPPAGEGQEPSVAR
jgi:hypothetical protein